MSEERKPLVTPSDAPTAAPAYAERLANLGGKRWKRLLDVQRPYRWNLLRHVEGEVLEVGCGLGRNLSHLTGRAVGVDHNVEAVEICRALGHTTYSPAQFHQEMQRVPRCFDTLLLAHVLEHMPRAAGVSLLEEYLPYLRPGGLVLLVCPQEAGFASDDTHVEFLDAADMQDIAARAGCLVEAASSFPFPRRAGRLFRYNETVVTARMPAAPG